MLMGIRQIKISIHRHGSQSGDSTTNTSDAWIGMEKNEASKKDDTCFELPQNDVSCCRGCTAVDLPKISSEPRYEYA